MTTFLLIVGLVAVAGGSIWLLARYAAKQGRAEARRDAAKKGLDHARKAAEIRDNLGQLTDAERAEWLQRRDRSS